MHIDPHATLRLWSVDVDIAGRTYTIPPLPARDWIVAAHGDWADIVPGLLAGADDLDEAIADGRVGHGECVTAARAALAAASGTKWWTAQRLAHCAGENIGAELVRVGVDPDRIPFARWLQVTYLVATRHAKDVDVARIDAELDSPPQGLAVDEWWDDSAEIGSFAAAMAATSRR